MSNRPKHLKLLKTSDGNLCNDSLIAHAHRLVCILAALFDSDVVVNVQAILINMYILFCL